MTAGKRHPREKAGINLPGNRWRLPAGVEDCLPPVSGRLRDISYEILHLYQCWGYDLIIPPLLEYLNSLMAGAGDELALHTFKLTDQASGHSLGVRADMTPQSARIDANRLQHAAPNRLCYLGEVLRARPDGPDGSRCLLQTGAELFGHKGVGSDAEILSLMCDVVRLAGIGDDDIHLDLGHVGLFHGLLNKADVKITDPRREELIHLVWRKAEDDLRYLIRSWRKSKNRYLDYIVRLLPMRGRRPVIAEAKRLFSKEPSLLSCLNSLSRLADLALASTGLDEDNLYFDLAEISGSRYHNGLIFSIYHAEQNRILASGGRYDNIGQDFGRGRPATGFSADVKTLMRLGDNTAPEPAAILAPPPGTAKSPAALRRAISRLRNQGEIVMHDLGEGAVPEHCRRELVLQSGRWHVRRRK